jgi:hypothetical protein
MPLTFPFRRRLALGSVALLALAGCGALPSGPRQIDISQAQLLERIASRFPVKQRYLGLFEVTLDQPRLRLLPEENRVGTELSYLVGVPLPGSSDIKGKLELSYGLRYEPSDTTLRLTQARVERLDVDGLNAAQAAQVKKVGGLLTEDLLKEAVVHRLKKEDMESLAGRGYRPGVIRVVPGGLRLTLDPLPR